MIAKRGSRQIGSAVFTAAMLCGLATLHVSRAAEPAVVQSFPLPLGCLSFIGGTHTMATSPGVTVPVSTPPAQPPHVSNATPAEVSGAECAFMDLRHLVEIETGNAAVINGRKDESYLAFQRQSVYRKLGIYPSDPPAFVARVQSMFEEERAFQRSANAELCARKNEIVTLADYQQESDLMAARLAAWRVGRYRAFLASLTPEDRIPKTTADNSQWRALTGSLPGLSVVEYPLELRFQGWRESSCVAAE